MIKRTNYRKLDKRIKNMLTIIVCTLFPESKFKRIRIKKDGNIILIQEDKPFFRKGIKTHLSTILFQDIPAAISQDLYNSIDFATHLRKKLFDEMADIDVELPELTRMSRIINYIHTELILKDLIVSRKEVEFTPVFPILNEDKIINVEADTMDTHPMRWDDNLLFIFRGILHKRWGNSSKWLKVAAFAIALNLARVVYSPVTASAVTDYKYYVHHIITPLKMCFFNTS